MERFNVRKKWFRRSRRYVGGLVGLGLFLGLGGAPMDSLRAAGKAIPITELERSEPVDFDTEILPFLKRSCLACHNQTRAKAGLVLESPKAIRAGSDDGAVVAPSNSEESLLLKVASRQQEPFMPPEDNNANAEPLSSKELGLLKLWIEEGAKGSPGTEGDDSESAEEIEWQPLPTGVNPIYSVAMTSDGRYVACGRANQIFIYDLVAARLFDRLTAPDLLRRSEYSKPGVAHRDLVQSLAFAPGRRYLASGGFRTVKLWKRASIGPRKIWKEAEGKSIRSVAVSPAARWLAAGTEEGEIYVWDRSQGGFVYHLKRNQEAITDLMFSEDGEHLFSGSLDRRLLTWKLSSGALVGRVIAPGGIQAIALTHKRKQVAAVGKKGEIWWWGVSSDPRDAGALTPDRSLNTGRRDVIRLEAFGANRRKLASAARDGSVDFWDLDTGKKAYSLSLEGTPEAIEIRSAAGQLATLTQEGVAELWDLSAGERIASLSGDPRPKREIIRKERQIAVEKKRLERREDELTAARKEWEEHIDVAAEAAEKIVKARAQLKERRQAAGKEETGKKDAEALAEAKRAILKTVQDSEFKIEAAREFADAYIQAQKAVARAKERLQVAKEALAKAKKAYESSHRPIQALAAGDGNDALATLSRDGLIQTWAWENGNGLEAFATGITNKIGVLASMGKGGIVASTKEGDLAVWDTSPSWELARVIGNSSSALSPLEGRATSLDFSPDGKLLAVGSGQPSRKGQLTLWSTEDGTKVREWSHPHGDTVLSVAFSPNGAYLATGGADRLVKVFKVNDGALVEELQGHGHHILDLAWRADGAILASASADHVIKLWDVEKGEHVENIGGFDTEVTAIEFLDLDNKLLATSGEGILRIGSKRITVKDRFLYDAATDFDRGWIAAGGYNSVLRVWNADTLELRHQFAPAGEGEPQGLRVAE